jgi:hypothetical protein
MFEASWASGIGILSVFFAIPLLLFFRNRNFGLFDPLNFFLITRVATMLAALVLLLTNAPPSLNLVLLFFSVIFFVLTLYLATPARKYVKFDLSQKSYYYFFRFTVILILIKIGILFGVSGKLPIFSEGGSDAYISFDVDNKLGSSLLLGLGNADIVLLAFLIPLTSKRGLRFLVFVFLSLAILMSMSTGKKSAILGIFLAVAFGEYLRIALISNQKRYFLSGLNIIVSIALGICWAAWIYARTVEADFAIKDIKSIIEIMDFIMFQWSYVYFIFISNDMDLFFQTYHVNQWTYFFHSLLSPLGFPAFHASIGPAIQEYLTGEITGHGVNPSFVVEGYVLFGNFTPLYAIVVALVIAKARLSILRIRSLEYKVIIAALLLPALYSFPSDSLYFAKIFYVTIFIVLAIAFPLRFFTYEK